jgi:hypothetical protein
MDFYQANLGGFTSPGSIFPVRPFGQSNLSPDFRTTVTQLYEVQLLGAGQDANGRVIRAYAFELTSTGVTRLNGVTDTRGNAVGEEQARVIANVPCI